MRGRWFRTDTVMGMGGGGGKAGSLSRGCSLSRSSRSAGGGVGGLSHTETHNVVRI